jgi:hypothetical protein
MKPFIAPSLGASLAKSQQQLEIDKFTKVAQEIEKVMTENGIKNYEIQSIIEIYSNRHAQRINNMLIGTEIETMKDYEYTKPNVSPKPQQ